jgi:hypothetical protein
MTELAVPRDSWSVAFCAWPDEATSTHGVRELQRAGWSQARALTGGWDAWQATGLPIEMKPKIDVWKTAETVEL